MYKNATYKEKLQALRAWLPMIFQEVKKEIKNEHVRQDSAFHKKYLQSKNLNKIALEDFISAYDKAIEIEENGEQIAEFIANRWLMKNADIYDYFEISLKQIDPNFQELEQINEKSSWDILEKAIFSFGAPKTYLFSVLNSVVFPKEVYEKLQGKAVNEQKENAQKQEEKNASLSLEGLKRNHEQEIARITDKFEKKMAGLEKKYMIDVAGLKKQIATLQKKLVEGK